MQTIVKSVFGIAALAAVAGCVDTAGTTTGMSDEAACLRAVSERAASSSNTVLSYETSEANNLAMIRDQYGVTWRCLVNGGSVVELNVM